MTTSPHEALEGLDDDHECVRTTNPDAYIWHSEDEDTYYVLDKNQKGTWYAHPAPVPSAFVEARLATADSYDIEEQTQIPAGRHQLDT